MSWDQLYNFLGIHDLIYFISSPSIQDQLFWMKLVFIFFTVFFLAAVIWFYLNSSYIQYQFLQDTAEFLSWESYGLRQISRRWNKIVKKTEFGSEAEYKLAFIEADDFLAEMLTDTGYEGETFEEMARDAADRMVPSLQEMLEAHKVRDRIVYDPAYSLDLDQAKKMLADYESSIKKVYQS